jgi:hypothetical protein
VCAPREKFVTAEEREVMLSPTAKFVDAARQGEKKAVEKALKDGKSVKNWPANLDFGQ